MELERLSEVVESVSFLQGARLRNGEKPSGSERTGVASISETGLTPLYGDSQRPFHAVVGRLNAMLVDKTEETVEVLANRVGEIGDVTIFTIPPAFGKSSKPAANAF